MEELLQFFPLSIRQHIPGEKHHGSPQKKTGARLQLFLQVLQDVLKTCLGGKSQGKT